MGEERKYPLDTCVGKEEDPLCPLGISPSMGRITYPLPPAGYYPYLRGRVSYNRKHRASKLSP